MADDDDKGCPNRDVMHLGPDIGNGYHPYVRHKSDHGMETGFITARKPGNDEAAPPCDGIVRLSHTGPGPTFDVESLYERPAPPTDVAGSHSGPAMVTTEAYRDGWDRIFGGKQAVGQA